ncbi:rod shape-determining protein MreC [Candidatus Chloroploca sp. M-50]|uniref:Cell shape-determining protein MreC n=1 Tax=Candidatus Chloroploca mongolica TaxID=2528176 RepID=A0ABS4D8Z6_9CHLR|nr:rod shape-determining protein MreC [Candidatus Chloroploca mongolica]MBP1465902.1 rod shape-determining protein MreC [Candidatus Chloroploca mongolica]
MHDLLNDKPIKLRRSQIRLPLGLRSLLVGLFLCGMAFLLIILDSQGTLAPARAFVQQGLAPVAQVLTGIRGQVDGFATAPFGDAAVRARLQELERENSRLADQLLRLEQAQVENVFLRQQLQIQREHPWTLLGAEVTVRSPDAGRRVIVIARGTREGVAPGMAVISQLPGGPTALIGIVEGVGPSTAEVLLITDISSQISARVMSEGRSALGMMQGQWQNGSRLRLNQVDRGLPLKQGASVMTAGMTAALNLPLDLASVPSNIPVGVIEEVRTAENYQYADLRPLVDPDQVRYVWVILNQDD